MDVATMTVIYNMYTLNTLNMMVALQKNESIMMVMADGKE